MLICAVFAGVTGCEQQGAPPLLERISPDVTHITFRNEIVEQEGLNVLVYEYFYNGAGVAAGDLNADGLPDLYFTSNMGPNALYINEGDFRFRDVTASAGVEGGPGWKTGVVMADVNADGLLDIYVCKSGRVSEPVRRNELYVNNGDLTFTERAAEFGLDDPSYSTHASFFDSDGDGDLDMFLVNHSVERYSRFDVSIVKQMRDPLAGDKLYRNDSGRFVDVTAESGIYGNPIGFGLSATVGDVNGDGRPDIFVANDYIEDDYLYVNNGDGTFREEIRERFGVTSYSSMGADIADVNNDGRLDIITLDMMSADPVRRKQLQGPNGYDRYADMLEQGYFPQLMRNMLQLNNGNGTFSEIGQLAGIAETDWSWAPLVADLDNDGLKDLYVTNGYLRDYTDMDFLTSTLQDSLRHARMTGEPIDAIGIVEQIPQTPIRDYVFKNINGLQFDTPDWGITEPSFSNGAVYADLDVDGDLDLVVNNINQEAFVYRNHAERDRSNRYLRVHLEGPPQNTYGIGSRVEVRGTDGFASIQELQPVRGYLSSVQPILHFGLGAHDSVDVHVRWPDGSEQEVAAVASNQTLTLHYRDASTGIPAERRPERLFFVNVPDRQGLDFIHRENDFIDFDREPLLPHMLSRLGPAMASADVNGDGLRDVFFGGARGQPGAIYFQQSDGSFRTFEAEALERDAAHEDVAAVFLDVDGDNDPDLYVVSGGNWETDDMTVYQDRLYLNNGFGQFETSGMLPAITSSGGAVAAQDFDADGDVDLFVGGRVVPGRYPESPRSYLLENVGDGFVDVTPELLQYPGMVTSVLWADLDPRTDAMEIALAGEWMPIRLFRFDEGRLVECTSEAGLDKSAGWWNVLKALDLNGDGHVDLVAGNRGLNHWMRADEDRPVSLYAGDFGHDASIDPVLTYVAGDQRYPEAWRDELLDQIPPLRRKFPDYRSYASATFEHVLTEKQIASASRLDAFEFATSIFENRGDGSFEQHQLPLEAQFAPVNDVEILDLNQDGAPDLLLAGNNFWARAQWGPFTAGRGSLLINEGAMSFRAIPPSESGFFLPGDVRQIEILPTPLGTLVAASHNDGAVSTFGVNYITTTPPLASGRDSPAFDSE